MGPCCFVHVSAGASVPSSAEDLGFVERLDSAVHIPSSRAATLSIFGPGHCCTVLMQDLHSRFPVQIGQQVDDINHHSHATFFQALHNSVEATCMLAKELAALGMIVEVLCTTPHIYEQQTAQTMATSRTCLSTTLTLACT